MSSSVGSPGMELDNMFPQFSILGDADDHFSFLLQSIQYGFNYIYFCAITMSGN